jgi:replication factor A1
MKTEAYISKIIEDTGLTRNDIKTMVEEKKNELKGLISEEGALFIIAKELGVDVKDENKDFLKDIDINIADITPNMKNITLIGRIKQINKTFSFNKKDGGVGKVGSFILHDNTGQIRMVLWDDHTNILEQSEFERNELVKILNGYAKKGKNEDTEVHIGRLGRLILSPEDVDYKKYPKIKDVFIPIKDINLSLSSVSIEGKIIQIFPTKEFTKKNGEIGKVGSLTVVDSTGSTKVTFWNEDTEKINGLKTGDIISITDLNPRLSTLDSKSIDLFCTRYSNVAKKDKKIKIEGDFTENIKELQEKQGIVSFQGIISSVDNLKKVTMKTGEDIYLLGFVISDKSDWIRVTIWREKAEEYSKKLTLGKGILAKNVLVKYSNFSSRNEISLISDSKLEFIDLDIKNLKTIETPKRDQSSNFTGNYTKIKTINASGTVEVKGFIAKELNNISIYEACPNCFKKIENCSCDDRNKTEYRMIFNLIIDDGSGTIRTTFIGDTAEKFIGEETEKLLQIKETPDFEKFLSKKSSEFLGKDIVIKGRAKFSDYSNLYEIVAYDFKDINVSDELEKVMNEIET